MKKWMVGLVRASVQMSRVSITIITLVWHKVSEGCTSSTPASQIQIRNTQISKTGEETTHRVFSSLIFSGWCIRTGDETQLYTHYFLVFLFLSILYNIVTPVLWRFSSWTLSCQEEKKGDDFVTLQVMRIWITTWWEDCIKPQKAMTMKRH